LDFVQLYHLIRRYRNAGRVFRLIVTMLRPLSLNHNFQVAPMDRAKTITEVKAAFIRTQVRLLSAVLQPSQQWRDFADIAEEDNLSDKVIHDVMSRGMIFFSSDNVRFGRLLIGSSNVSIVNTKLKEHNRSVYSAPSQRHVAEQIDALYWDIVSKDDMQADHDTVIVTKDADLTQTEYIRSHTAAFNHRT
jgi:hypothetical protein